MSLTAATFLSSLRRCFSATTSTSKAAAGPLVSPNLSPPPPFTLRPYQEVWLPKPFPLVHGGSLPRVGARVEVLGDPTLPLSRTVVIFPSFSHSAHVARHTDDPGPGWWEGMVGPGKPIDTRHWRVICASNLGSPFSITNPAVTLGEGGKPLRAAFPTITPTDLARCHAEVLKVLLGEGVVGGEGGGATTSKSPTQPNNNKLHALVGASMGGMQALQFASLFPHAASRVLAVCTTGRTTPFTVAIRTTQRQAILTDPEWWGGEYGERGVIPERGLRLARELGTMFYRSREEFDGRFEWSPGGSKAWTGRGTWEVEGYLSHAGDKFVRTFDANSYLVLSKAMDLMDLGDGWGEGRGTWADGARRIASGGCKTLLVGVKQDALIPPKELQALEQAMNAGGGGVGGSALFMELDSEMGHDAFLVPKAVPKLLSLTREFLEGGLETSLKAESEQVGGPAC